MGAIAWAGDYWYIFAMGGQDDESVTSGWDSVRWHIPLASPPDIVSIGVGVHGTIVRERFLLPDLWCLHLYSYSAKLRLGETLFPIRPGFAGITPPNTPIEYIYDTVAPHLYCHFRLAPSEATEPILAMQDMGAEFPRFYSQMEQAVRGIGLPVHRAQARIWDILGELSQRTGSATADAPATHPAVQHAISQIELHIGETLSVADLARDAYVSYSYLGRLFQAAYGTTVVGYIRARRMQQAEHLLRHSTLPIKTIAATVGIPDLHLFNKTVRQTFGKSPRALRQPSSLPLDE